MDTTTEILRRLEDSMRLLAQYERLLRDSGDCNKADAVREHNRRNGEVVRRERGIQLAKRMAR